MARSRGAAVAGLAVHGQRFVAAAGQLDQVQAQRVQHGHHLFGVVGAEAAALEIGRVDFHRHGEAGAYGLAHFADDVQQQAGAVFQVAAPAVGALVGDGGQKLADR